LILTQHDLAVGVRVLVRRKIHRALKHPLSPFKRRTLYSVVILALVLALGTEGMHLLEGWSYVDSFYFVSLIATTCLDGSSVAERRPKDYQDLVVKTMQKIQQIGAVLVIAVMQLVG
jgi:phosphoglycerol transferase MdoB-like AlkP superfamily enzyme